MATINFISNPPFSVPLAISAPTSSTHTSTLAKVTTVARLIFLLIPTVAHSLTKSSWMTLSTAWPSFKVNVIHPAINIFKATVDVKDVVVVLVLGTPFWVLDLLTNVVVTTARLSYERLFPDHPAVVANESSSGLDLQHLQTKSVEIDMSKVDPAVKVDDLLTIFDQIDFVNKTSPHYMAASQPQRASLQNFVEYVNCRTPFLGTPPAQDFPRVEAFYQQIENAVRFTIDAHNNRMKEFTQTNGSDPTQYVPETLTAYRNIFEDRARVAIDLAIAGGFCGARFMGDAMTAFGNVTLHEGDFTGSFNDYLIELLAAQRKTIAEQQIQRYMGSDTHAYALYMSRLGTTLGIPGMKNVTEHLATGFNTELHLKRFFDDYTVDTVIDTIQDRFATSQQFREMVYDWVKSKRGEWTPGESQSDSASLANQIIARWNQEEPDNEHIKPLFKSVANIDDFPVWVDDGHHDLGWDDFVEKFLNTPAVRQWRDAQFKNPPQEGRAFINQVKGCLKSEAPNNLEAVRSMSKEDLLTCLVEKAQKSLKRDAKLNAIRGIIPLPAERIEALVSNPQALQRAINDLRAQDHDSQFLNRISEAHFPIIGGRQSISPALMEWITVSEHIFNPQIVRGSHG